MSLKRKPPEGNVFRVPSNGHSVRGVVTNKAGRIVQFENWKERALLLRLDRDPSIRDFGSRPERFQYVNAHGKMETIIPDLIVWRINGDVEIHELAGLNGQFGVHNSDRDDAMRHVCEARGWGYVVHHDESLPRGSELANLLVLYRYRPMAYGNDDVAYLVLDRLGTEGKVLLCQLITWAATSLSLPEPQVTGNVLHLVWHRKIEVDLSKLLIIDGELDKGALVWSGVDHS